MPVPKKRALVACSVVAAFLPAALSAATRDARDTKIADRGQTHIVENSSVGRVDVVLSTVSAPVAEPGPQMATRCSQGRAACSLVSGLTIRIGNNAIMVPQRAILLLADVNSGRVRWLNTGRYELILECGDAAAAYEARLFFDRHRVNRMDIWSPEAGSIEQSTVYKDVSKRFS